MTASPYSLVFTAKEGKGDSAPLAEENLPPHCHVLSLPHARLTIAQAVYLSGLFQPPALCSGLARCGRCRMLVEELAPEPAPADKDYFSAEEIAAGWRLACRHPAREGMRVRLPEGARRFGESYGPLIKRGSSDKYDQRQGPEAFCKYMLAADLGTTTLHWRLLELVPDGNGRKNEFLARPLWESSAVNPQMGAGSEVVSRLAAAMDEEGRRRLSELTLAALGSLVERALSFIPKRADKKIDALCLAANPAMTCLTLGVDAAGLARAPYRLPLKGGEWVSAAGLPPTWLPPQLSPFVGGDVSAGYAFLALNPEQRAPAYPFLLADLGTNGEFLLALSPEKAWSASVALGPALEGAGLSFGTEARPGAVASFNLTPKGVEPRPLLGMPPKPDGSRACPGITGTGYISLLPILLRAGALGRDGSFRPGSLGPLERFFRFAHQGKGGELCLALPMGLRLPATDVEELLKVKAAFSLGLQRLLDVAGVRTGQLAKIYIAGALGLHADKGALEELGFLPQGVGSRVEAVGNSSLGGAAVLLQFPAVRDKLTAWAENVQSLELAGDAVFLSEFPAHMRFAWI